MQYDDFKVPSMEDYENMAKAYSLSLKNQGFVFVKLEKECENFLIDEIFDILFKIDTSIDAMSRVCDTQKIKSATTKHIKILRDMFNYDRQVKFEISNDESLIFLNLISLENTLTMKLFTLSTKSSNFEKLLDIIFDRLKIYAESFSLCDFKLTSIQ